MIEARFQGGPRDGKTEKISGMPSEIEVSGLYATPNVAFVYRLIWESKSQAIYQFDQRRSCWSLTMF